MACNPEVLKHVPLFALLDEEETAVLAGQVRLKTFAPRQRIYKIGDSSGQAYVVVSGRVRVSTVDQEQQEVVVDEPSHGEFFGFASMLEQTPHQTEAVAIDEVVCLEVNQKDIAVLLQRKPLAGMDMLRVLGRQFHASQQLVRLRANRHPNEVIEKDATFGERIADTVAGVVDIHHYVQRGAGNLYDDRCRAGPESVGSVSIYITEFIFVDAGGGAGAGDHDESEPAGYERPSARRTRLRRESQG
jgi:CRP-like cAMP-binding protein